MIVGRRWASMVLPAPGGPIMRTLWPPAAATVSARSWPRTSLMTPTAFVDDGEHAGAGRTDLASLRGDCGGRRCGHMHLLSR